MPQVHTMFSLLSVEEAYVTHLGRVVGVITLTELRDAILKEEGSQRTASK